MKSILQNERYCYLSGRSGPLEKHHVLNGPCRDFAEENGLWVYITPEWHRKLHGTGDGVQIQKRLKTIAQLTYERNMLIEMLDAEDAYEKVRGVWMQKVRRNYDG